METSAEFSKCRTWRYTLTRSWSNRPNVLFILLNPSTADETNPDPTLTRAIGFARDWNFGGLVFCNLFAFRATIPKDMKQAPDPIGPQNDYHIMTQAQKANQIIVAWGVDGDYRSRDVAVLKLLKDSRFKLVCLGKTKNGFPKHPLFLPRTTRRGNF